MRFSNGPRESVLCTEHKGWNVTLLAWSLQLPFELERPVILPRRWRCDVAIAHVIICEPQSAKRRKLSERHSDQSEAVEVTATNVQGGTFDIYNTQRFNYGLGNTL